MAELKLIASYKEACKKLNIDPTTLPVVDKLNEKYQKSIIAHYKLVIIAEALNDGWLPNWLDHSEYKYYPWFYVDANAKTAASGFSYNGCAYWDTATAAPGRLYFKNRELAIYAGKKFKKLYRDYLMV